MAETNLAQAVEAADAAGTYDANAKFLLADKQVLARILKYAVREFGDMELQDIMAGIGDDIEVGTRQADPGLTNLGRAGISNTEDNIPGEGKIFYDIRFSAYHRMEEMKFLVNVEAQKSSDPVRLGYHLENRVLYYLARMVSAQKQTEFFHSDYDSLRRVRSIWICMDFMESPERGGNSIEEISLNKKTVCGRQGKDCELDLMKGIIINIGGGDSANVLISMLENLFSLMNVAEKKRILSEEYGMIMTAELEGRLQTMCNLSENIEARGMEKGMEKGIKQERLDAVRRMIRAGATKGQIISFGYSEDEFAEAKDV